METLDIALVHPELIYPRGAEKQLCNLARELMRAGHGVTVYTFEKKSPYIFDHLLEGSKIISLDKPWRVEPLVANYPRWYSLCRELAGKMGPHDIINCHNFPASWVPHFAKKPSVWMCNEPPGLYSYLQPLSARNALKKLFYRPFSVFDQRMTKGIHTIACLDRMMEKTISVGYPGRRLVVVGSGAELEKEVKHEENKAADVLFVGALDQHKRAGDIVEALGKLRGPPIKLHIVGSGPLRNAIESRARALGVDLATYGNVDEETLYSLYSIADLAVYVPESQPWGIFPLEAILCGIPTVISDECGVRDILEGGIPVVKRGDTDELARKISDLIANPQNYKKGLEEKRLLLKKEYTWKAYAGRMAGLFREALAE